jgi:hypothetical protein
LTELDTNLGRFSLAVGGLGGGCRLAVGADRDGGPRQVALEVDAGWQADLGEGRRAAVGNISVPVQSQMSGTQGVYSRGVDPRGQVEALRLDVDVDLGDYNADLTSW